MATLPANSAETIYFDYGFLGRTLPVSSLETFAEEGIVDNHLEPFFRAIPPDKQQQFQQVLTTSIDELNLNVPQQFSDPFVLSQWLYSPIGESTLVRTGELIQTAGRLNGQYAIRAAIVLAAADPEGLSLLNIIRAYPTGGIRLNLPNILTLVNAINTNRKITEELLATVVQSSAAAAASEPELDYGALPILAQTGPFAVEQQSLVLRDLERDRTLPTELFMPANLDAVSGSLPVMIMSHGYGHTRNNPEAIRTAQILAAHGYVVALPEHVGSNKQYQNELETGLNHESFDAMEFINRPLDIRFLLNTLEQQNETAFRGRLQLNRVGLLGHSFGGYTILISAGATVDIDYLEAQCTVNNDVTSDQINIALALQCRALELKSSPNILRQLTDGSLADSRIALVFALSPVGSLFGETGVNNIQAPVVIMGGAMDIASPVALEQAQIFERLTATESYLYLAEELSHSPELTRIALGVTNPNAEAVEGLNQAQNLFTDLLITLAIAYSNVYLQGDASYLPYLTSAYVETNSAESFRLYLIRSLD